MDDRPGCIHRHTKILKYYRRNYPFGKGSKPKKYDPPRLCREICASCGKELYKWKPK